MKRVTVAAGGLFLVLSGWIFGGRGDFNAVPARPVSVGILAIVLASLGDRLTFGRDTEEEEWAQRFVAYGAIAVVGAGLFLIPMLDAAGVEAIRIDDRTRWVGLGVFGLGQLLLLWSLVSLGRWYTPMIAVLPGQELIQHSPYRYVRHPFYAGFLASTAGFPAVFGSLIGVVLVVLVVPFLIWRMDSEERLLETRFGEAYRSMKARTYRLIPRLY